MSDHWRCFLFIGILAPAICFCCQKCWIWAYTGSCSYMAAVSKLLWSKSCFALLKYWIMKKECSLRFRHLLLDWEELLMISCSYEELCLFSGCGVLFFFFFNLQETGKVVREVDYLSKPNRNCGSLLTVLTWLKLQVINTDPGRSSSTLTLL